MLDFALKNKLLGEYESIYGLFGVNLINIPRVGLYEQLKTEMQTLVNRLKVEAGQFEQVVILMKRREKSRKNLEYTTNLERYMPTMVTIRRASSTSPEFSESKPVAQSSVTKTTSGSGVDRSSFWWILCKKKISLSPKAIRTYSSSQFVYLMTVKASIALWLLCKISTSFQEKVELGEK